MNDYLNRIKTWLIEPEEDDEEINERSSDIENISDPDSQKSIIRICKPRSFMEAERYAQDIKRGDIVLLDISLLPTEEKQRLLDFLSGVILAKDGSIKRLSKEIILYVSDNVEIIRSFYDS